MARTILKSIHYLALAAFVGSIFTHILLGTFAGSSLPGDVLLLGIKVKITKILIFGGLGLLVASGTSLIVVSGGLSAIKMWLKIKLVLVALVVANAAFFLAPAGVERSRQATEALAGIPLQSNYADLGVRESVFGAINLALVLCIIVLSVRRRPV